MPVVTELFDGRSGGIEAGGQGNEGIQRRWVRRFRVIMDDWREGALHVAVANGIPRIGDPYVCLSIADLGARCHSVQPEATDEPRQWYVTAEYSTSSSDIGDIEKEKGTASDPNDPNNNAGDQGGGGDSGNNPLSRPAEIVYESQQTTKIATLGYNTDGLDAIPVRTPISSSAGEPFDPPIEISDSVGIVSVTRNQASFSPAIVAYYVNKINQTPWFGFASDTVRCTGIGARSMDEQGQRFWSVTYSFEVRESWEVKVLDQGFYQIVAGEKQPILDFGGGRLSAPWPLDGDGEELTPAAVAAGSFVYRTYRVYDRADFNTLNLP